MHPGNSTFSTVASAMPIDDNSSAETGVPRALNSPNRRGAYPARARLNIIRVVMYNWLFMAESAATRITKFTTPAAQRHMGTRHHGYKWTLALSRLRPGNDGQDDRHCQQIEEHQARDSRANALVIARCGSSASPAATAIISMLR